MKWTIGVYGLIFLALTLLVMENLFGQEKRIRFIGVETGVDKMHFEIYDFDNIRKNISSYGSYSLYGSFQKYYGGINAEIRTVNNRFGLLGGLRYTGINSSLGIDERTGDADFFYFLYKEEGTNSEYLKIIGIDQSSNYLGVPVELRLFLFRSRFARLYLTSGLEFSYLLSTSTDVLFENDEMEVYQNDVVQKFEKPNNYFSTIHFSTGCKFGWDDRGNLNVELTFLSFILKENTSSFVNPDNGIAFKIYYELPF